MWRTIHLIVLLSYLNVLCFEVKYCNFLGQQPVALGETLIEVVLQDVLNLKQDTSTESVPEIMYDDYRIFNLIIGLIPLVLYFSWLLRRVFALNDQIKHVIYFFKRLILPGYYSFLYRYRPF
ncbi:hypothetical protein [Sphingobacterium bovistauri]|uniref:Uncharacterized protein n=1 Tax=Sphingobacterium bovistauri TaxID=2781959 RepID=A0ABS7Z4Y9_9SPHI|nr:hypothetical protein [Sphingobacterium bovistauri]MCA5005073.1 hypothetical protein [Sphingobacterium bovistauri]